MATTNFKDRLTHQKCNIPFSYPNSIKFQTKNRFSTHKITQKVKISIPTNSLQLEFQQYEWRKKTEFPIVKVISYRISSSIKDNTNVLVEIQSATYHLDRLRDLPLFKILYLLKQAIIGFERLFNRVGAFQISPQMVIINQNNHCKVWWSSSFQKNSYRKLQISEHDFLTSIYSIFEKRSNKLKNTLLFFSNLKQTQKFCQALLYIENFAKENKMTLSSSCQINPQEKIDQLPLDKKYALDGKKNQLPKHLLSSGLRLSLQNNLRTLSNSPSHQNLIKSLQKIQSWKKRQQLKWPGKSTADIKEGIDEDKEQKFTNNLLEIQEKQKRSMHPKKTQTQLRYLTPNHQQIRWRLQSQYIRSIEIDKIRKDSEQQESSDNKQAIKSIFNKNNWEIAVTDLFSDDKEIRASIHKGKQIQRADNCTAKLPLLNQFGKEVLFIDTNVEEF